MALTLNNLSSSPIRSYDGYTVRIDDPYTPTPFGHRAVISDTLTSTVAITVTTTNVIHTDLGAADDTTAPVPSYGHWLDGYIESTIPYGPVISDTGSLEYGIESPQDWLRGLGYQAPFVALTGLSVLVTTFAVTVTDTYGQNVSATSTLISANPISISPQTLVPQNSLTPLAGFTVTDKEDVNGDNEIITVQQQDYIHSDPGAIDDQKSATTAGIFSPQQIQAVPLSISNGSITGSGAASSSLVSEIASISFAPSAGLTGNQILEADFTITATGTNTGSSASSTYAAFYTNPLRLSIVEQRPQYTGQSSVVPLSLTSLTDTASTSFTLVITEANKLHTDLGAADDTTTAIGFGTFSNGRSSITLIGSANAIQSELAVLSYTPPAQVFGGNQAIETDFIATVMDSVGNSNTSEAQTTFLPIPAPTPIPTPISPSTPTPTGTGSEPGQSSTDPAVYRFFDAVHGTQFLTASSTEATSLQVTRPDLTFEGIDLYSVNATDTNATPVYRFFDKVYGTHFYTSSAAEEALVMATRLDLTYEGIGFYEHATQQSGDVPVYRFFEQTNGTHFYTSSAAEKTQILALRSDLTFEGVGFYAPSG